MFLRRLRDQPHRWGASRICLFVTLFVFCGCGSIRVEQCQRRILGYGTDATWSPDGKNIAFLSQDQLCVVSADGRRGARNLTPDMSVCGFAWSPDSRSIAFGASTGLSRLGVEDDGLYWPRGSAGELGVVNSDGESSPRILTSGVRRASFTWSPESREVLCEVYTHNSLRDSADLLTNETSDSAELQAIDAGSGLATRIDGPHNLNDRVAQYWRWLKDDNIALIEYRGSFSSARWRLVDRFGGTDPKVTSKEKLFYWARDSTLGEVCWIMNADGTERVRLVPPSQSEADFRGSPYVSINGRKLAVVTWDSHATGRLFVTDLQGKSWLKLGDSLEDPQWSPDGRWLTCTQPLDHEMWSNNVRYLLVSADGRFRLSLSEPFIFAPVGNNVMYVTYDGTISTSRLWIHWWPFRTSKTKKSPD